MVAISVDPRILGRAKRRSVFRLGSSRNATRASMRLLFIQNMFGPFWSDVDRIYIVKGPENVTGGALR